MGVFKLCQISETPFINVSLKDGCMKIKFKGLLIIVKYTKKEQKVNPMKLKMTALLTDYLLHVKSIKTLLMEKGLQMEYTFLQLLTNF